jgi:flagellar biosynthesis/type III secretory pathway chaperone
LNWKRLIDILSEEKTVYAELLDLAGEKREAIFQKEVKTLDAVVRREQAAAARLNHWEKQRLVCMDALDGRLSLGPGSSGAPTLLFFADQAPAEERASLRTLHDELSEMLRKLSKSNAENKALIESRLEYVRFALDALNAEQTAGLAGSGYGPGKTDGGMIQRTIFDIKG